ncbi:MULTISPECIES: hypothetical protein [unclassified Methanoregula]|uniref:hypothetical protein n=1 Tax=unclassified Methanoregula TaxID=2649730 RepID=UPI0009C98EE7|nr:MULTISPECIES: hypothetical protein [unclassified Methanoregula]OPX64836.1 MAG: hypothetical protein A4E33_00574 [Methanoregula sp. PtaB.Bin085]OPY32888.1 MAG: hypothetical protein A4E34_02265 [Methanoregula sp. PtaU1.Bin006]
MGSPYLNSGETIVLTTNRVVAEGVSYDVMLTSERLFLIDNRMARLEPRIIPLSAILAVQGGKTPAQEPVITIVFREKREGERVPPLNLLFSQMPNENRKPERDDWVRGLIRLSIHVQEKEREPEKPVVPQVPQEAGLRPMARHGVAPDMVRPLSNIADHTQPVPVMVIPEDIPGSGEIPHPAEADKQQNITDSAHGEIPEVPATYFSPVRGRPLPPPPPHTKVIIPQIIEELLPEKVKPEQIPPETPEPAPAGVIDQEALFRTIPASVRPVTVTEERAPVPAAAEEIAPEPDSGSTGLDTGAPEPVPEPYPNEEKELPEILKALYTGPREPVTKREEIASNIPEPDTEEERGGEEVSVSQMPERKTEDESARQDVSISQVPEPVTGEGGEGEEVSAQRIREPVAADTGTEPVAEDIRPEQEPVHRWSELFAPGTESAAVTAEPIPGTAEPSDDHLNAAGREPAVPEASPVRSTPAEPPVAPRTEEVQTTEPEAAVNVPVRHPVPPAREIRSIKTTLAYAGVLLMVVALVAAGAFLLPRQGQGPADAPGTVPVTTLSPVPGTPATILPQTTMTVLPVSSRSPVIVPQEGVWVRLTSTSEYYGNVGNTGMMRQVSGSGDTIHPIFWPDHPVLVSVQKKDNTGAVLTATVYRNGTAIGTRSVNSPMGTVEILIDPVTARAPGLSP